MREPAVAGMFYEKSADAIERQIRECFSSPRGPGDLPVKRGDRKLDGIVAPHAAYSHSGPCAAWAYKRVAEAAFADVYLILGACHSGSGTATTLENFSTPSGVVRIDQSFAGELMKKAKLKADDSLHRREHSIEVQLPFLQFATADFSHELKFMPLLVSDDIDPQKLGLDIKEAIMDSGKKVCILVSTNFTHYGRNYHYLPFSSDVQKQLYELDGRALSFVKRMDAKGFLDFAYESGATICGTLPLAVALHALGSRKASLLQYYTTGDITGDYKNTVGYASVAFEP